MANQFGVTFNGRRIVHPGAYDYIDASAMTVASEGSLNIPIVVGTADAGESGKVKWFTGADQARKYLRGGELPIALDMMFSPAPEGGGGASLIGVVVANNTTQASVTANGVKSTSIEYGEGGNRIQVKLEAGTVTGAKKYTAYRWDTEEMEVFDNLGAVMKVSYTGTSAYAVVDIVHTNGVATKLETKVGADSLSAVVDVSLDLTNGRFGTIDDVLRYINGLSDYTAEYVDYKSSELSSGELDAVAAQNIKTASYIMAVAGDIAYQVNRYSQLVDLEITGTVSDATEYTYLTGGAKGSAPNSWSEFFDTIKGHFSDILVVLTGSQTIHAEAQTHVQQMETRHQRQVLFTGGNVSESVEITKNRASLLNNSRTVLAYPGIFHASYENGKTALPPYFTAAMLAGRVAGVDPSEPITFDYFNLVGLERSLVAGDPEIEDLITSGVATLEKVQNGGIRLVQGITTYTGSNNVLYREISVRRGADYLSSRMRREMEETFVGKKGLRATVSAVETKAIDVLEQSIREGLINSYRNIVVRFQNTVVYVDYQVAPVEPINFILITSHFVPESFSNQQ